MGGIPDREANASAIEFPTNIYTLWDTLSLNSLNQSMGMGIILL